MAVRKIPAVLQVSLLPNASSPVTPTITPGSTGAIIEWEPIAEAASYKVLYALASAPNNYIGSPIIVNAGSTLEAIITGLTESRMYQVNVIPINSSNVELTALQSGWIVFITSAAGLLINATDSLLINNTDKFIL